MSDLVIIGGATGVGKTECSIELAKKIGGEIISADSMQVYKGFNIGTAKITEDEKQGVPHYLIDILEPDQDFNVFEFQKRCKEAMYHIYSNGHVPIIVGGTGFYIQSVLFDINFSEEDNGKEYRSELENLAVSKGPEYLHQLLSEVDPDAAVQIHANNVKRVIRALEFYKSTGQRISVHNTQQKENKSPYNFAYFVFNRERSEIYRRIELRVDKMIEEGLIDEIKNLIESGVAQDAFAMQGLGYKELLPYINGQQTLQEATDILKLNTRHFAKRQNTWFKRENDAIWLNLQEFPDNAAVVDKMIEILRDKKIV